MESNKKNKIPSTSSISPNDLMEKYLLANFSIHLNVVNGRLYYRRISNPTFQPMEDFVFNSIRRELRIKGIVVSLQTLRGTLFSDFVKRINPILEYFDRLPKWDGVDYIQQLADTVSTTKSDLWSRCLKKWIVGYAGCLIDDNTINQTVLIFTGGQGIGKTTWLQKLVPEILMEYYYSGNINPNSKDTLIKLAESCLINLDELESLNRAEITSMKELITKSSINIRRSYGYFSEFMPRRASFTGSVNSNEFLNDSTGSRRFLCFEVQKIDFQHSIEIDKVLSQAKCLFEEGFQFWLDAKEIAELEQHNESFRVTSAEEDQLKKYFEPCSKDEADHLISCTDLLALIKHKSGNKSNELINTRLGKALVANKYLKFKVQDRKVYAVKEKK